MVYSDVRISPQPSFPSLSHNSRSMHCEITVKLNLVLSGMLAYSVVRVWVQKKYETRVFSPLWSLQTRTKIANLPLRRGSGIRGRNDDNGQCLAEDPDGH